MSVKVTPYKLSPNSTPIEYKRVTPDDYMFGQFHQGLIQLVPNKAGYIVDDLLNKLKSEYKKSDTTLINVGIGQGKTTAAYKIVDHYARQDDFVVIVVSPFKKLVRRDYEKLRQRPYKVANYTMAEAQEEDEKEEENLKNILDSKVHIVTINTLIHNPGEGNFQMSNAKLNYIKGIKHYCDTKNKKVVFIFDEIHAGVHNYQQKLMFNLLTWQRFTHKCFVLSATFTEACMVATECIGRLTGDRFKIYEAPRKKLPVQSDLHLYVTSEDYTSKDLTLISPLADIVEREATSGNRVHIITAYKDWAKRITDKSSNSRVAKAINEYLDYQVLTGEDEDAEFDEERSNIGTTFSTGVNIEKGADALVILMPSNKGLRTDNLRLGGIFTDGAVAIIQAMARLRGKGSIYVFLPHDINLIDPTYSTGNGNSDAFLKEHFSGEIPHFQYDHQSTLLRTFYYKQRKGIEKEIEQLEKEYKNIKEEGLYMMKLSIHYPELKHFTLESGDYFLASRYESFGRDFSPYVLWAAFNDQFANTTLRELNWVTKAVEKLELKEKSLLTQLKAFFGGIEALKTRLKGMTFEKGFREMLYDLSNHKVIDTEEFVKVELSYEGQLYTDSSKYPIPVLQALTQLLYKVLEGEGEWLSPEDYILQRMKIAQCLYKEGHSLSELDEAYFQLCKVKKSLDSFAATNKGTITSAFITDKTLKELIKIVKSLQVNDIFVRRLVFRFGRLTKPEMGKAEKYLTTGEIEKEFKETLRKRFFKALYNTFLDTIFKKEGVQAVVGYRDLPDNTPISRTFGS